MDGVKLGESTLNRFLLLSGMTLLDPQTPEKAHFLNRSRVRLTCLLGLQYSLSEGHG